MNNSLPDPSERREYFERLNREYRVRTRKLSTENKAVVPLITDKQIERLYLEGLPHE